MTMKDVEGATSAIKELNGIVSATFLKRMERSIRDLTFCSDICRSYTAVVFESITR